jgi:hypothetical protein
MESNDLREISFGVNPNANQFVSTKPGPQNINDTQSFNARLHNHTSANASGQRERSE